MTTKEKIIYEALDLFAIHGYEAVSMRDIGSAVGIRESSIYKHYAGKKAILNTIVESAVAELEGILVALKVPDVAKEVQVDQYVHMDFEVIADLCTKMVLAQGNNEIIRKLRQLLTIEQYRNKELREIYVEMFMTRQLKYNEKVFGYLLQTGALEGHSAKVMALEFFAPFFLLQYKYVNDQEQLEKELKEHAVIFIKEHLKGD